VRAVRESDVPTGELGRGVFCQIVEDKLDQSVGIVLARLIFVTMIPVIGSLTSHSSCSESHPI